MIPKGLCQCGCGERTNIILRNHTSTKRVKGEFSQFIIGHRRITKPEYVINPQTGCWEWQLSKSSTGYGSRRINYQTINMHKFYYEKYKGIVPNGLVLDHLCKNRGCVNPEHLEAVTQTTNCQRGKQAKLTWIQIRQIRNLYSVRAFTQKMLTEIFGVSLSTIQKTIHNKRWKEMVL